MKINKAKRVLSGLLVSVIGMSMLTGCAGLEEKTTEKEEQTFDIKKWSKDWMTEDIMLFIIMFRKRYISEMQHMMKEAQQQA